MTAPNALFADDPIAPVSPRMTDPCACCGEPVDNDNISVEAFEVLGKIMCIDCAEDALSEIDDADEGGCYGRDTQEWADHWNEQERDR